MKDEHSNGIDRMFPSGCVVTEVIYWEDDMNGVDVAVANGIYIATVAVAFHVGASVSVHTADVGETGMLWSLSTVTAAQSVANTTAAAAEARPPPVADTRTNDAATRTTDAAARPPSDSDIRTTAAARPTSTQGKPTFDADVAGIPDVAHATDVAA
jgi:hypothetical protein